MIEFQALLVCRNPPNGIFYGKAEKLY